jgi:hypothetical protein
VVATTTDATKFLIDNKKNFCFTLNMNWRKTIEIKSALDLDKDSDESAIEVCKKLAEILNKEYPFAHSDQSALYLIIQDLQKVKTQCLANKAIEKLYDWADLNKVWLNSF